MRLLRLAGSIGIGGASGGFELLVELERAFANSPSLPINNLGQVAQFIEFGGSSARPEMLIVAEDAPMTRGAFGERSGEYRPILKLHFPDLLGEAF